MNEMKPILRKAILEAVDNQLRDLDPPETKETFDRLIKEGFTEEEVRRLIGSVIVSELFNVVKQKEPYNEERFVRALRELPKMSWE